jgi:hypothetical protein
VDERHRGRELDQDIAEAAQEPDPAPARPNGKRNAEKVFQDQHLKQAMGRLGADQLKDRRTMAVPAAREEVADERGEVGEGRVAAHREVGGVVAETQTPGSHIAAPDEFAERLNFAVHLGRVPGRLRPSARAEARLGLRGRAVRLGLHLGEQWTKWRINWYEAKQIQ